MASSYKDPKIELQTKSKHIRYSLKKFENFMASHTDGLKTDSSKVDSISKTNSIKKTQNTHMSEETKIVEDADNEF